MINALARKAYLNTEIKILEKDIKAMTVFHTGNFEEPIYENIHGCVTGTISTI